MQTNGLAYKDCTLTDIHYRDNEVDDPHNFAT